MNKQLNLFTQHNKDCHQEFRKQFYKGVKERYEAKKEKKTYFISINMEENITEQDFFKTLFELSNEKTT